MTDFGDIVWATPNRGQIVEISYTSVEIGWVLRRTIDKSTGETWFHESRMLERDDLNWWEHAPANKRWRLVR